MRCCIFLFILVLASCSQEKPAPPVDEQAVREQMVNANRILVQKEAEEIKEFISRHGWKMEMTGTGLHYDIYKKGNGPIPDPAKPITASYTLYLLDGTFCYENDSLHPVTFMVGKGQQPRGLEEALLRMKTGSRARLVLPAHLAYATAGDGNKIPGNAALYIDVLLLPTAHE